MKITYSPAGSSDSYVIEGDIKEMEVIIDRIISSGSHVAKAASVKTQTSAPKTTVKPKPKAKANPAQQGPLSLLTGFKLS